MSRDDAYLLDILTAAKLAMRYVAGKNQADFLADTQCQDAVIRRIEIIGEASRCAARRRNCSGGEGVRSSASSDMRRV